MSGDTIEQLAKELFMSNDNEECHWERMPEHVKRSWRLTAKYVSRMIIEVQIAEITRIYPELNKDSGITIKLESPKHFSLKRIIELRKELENL